MVDPLKATPLDANIRFCEDDPAWTQVTLPMRCAGFGIRKAAKLVPFSFWPLPLPD